MSKLRRVALLVETSRAHGRGLLRGVKSYMSEHGLWSVFLERHDTYSAVPSWIKKWRGDGILVRAHSLAMVEAVQATGLPAVELRATTVDHGLPAVGHDLFAVGELAARYFCDLNFRNFACCVIDVEGNASTDLAEGFVGALATKNFTCDVYSPPTRHERTLDWEQQQEKLAQWLRGLTKPVAVLGGSDEIGCWLLDACLRAGIAVPEEVAVVGAGNDELLCSMTSPPLSSIFFNVEQIGYEAAALLDDLMSGKPAPAAPVLYPPIGITTRQSSDLLAIDDKEVAAAVRYIRENACAGLCVADVITAMKLPGRTLQRRIAKTLGRSLKEEILRIQFNRVRELLAQTNLPMTEIAVKAGFDYAEYMQLAFKKRFGCTPGEFRAEMHLPNRTPTKMPRSKRPSKRRAT